MPSSTGQKLLHHLRRAVLLHEGSPATDGELLRSFLTQRDEVAFEIIVRRHGPMVLGVCRRILNQSFDAEDAFQATFLVLIRKAMALQNRANLGDWLHGVAYHTALKAQAAGWKRRAKEKEFATRFGKQARRDDSWPEWRELFDRELSRLSAKQREAVVLCDLEGKTRQEAARMLGVPEGTLSGRLTTAHRKLAQRLARRGLALSSGTLAAALAQSAAEAGISSARLGSLLKAALLIGERGTTGLISANVAVLMDGVTRAMTIARVGTNALLIGAVLLCCGGGSLALWLSAAEKRSMAPQTAAPAKARAGSAPRPNQAAAPKDAPVDNTPVKDALRAATQALDNSQGDELARCRLWCQVADLREKLGDHQGAIAALRTAWALVKGSEWAVVEGARDIGQAYGRLGEAKAVMDLADSVPENADNRRDSPRQTILQESALAAAQAGHFGQAEQIAESMSDAATKSWVASIIGCARLIQQAKARDFAGALKGVEKLPTPEDKIHSLVGRGMLFLSFDDDALNRSPGGSADGIVFVQLQAGIKAAARQSALRASALLPDVEQSRRGSAVVAVVRALAKLDDLAAARLALSRIPEPDLKKERMAELKARASIAVAEVRAGQDDAALALTQDFNEPGRQAYILQEVALAQARAGRKVAAKANLEKAVELVRGSPLDRSGTTLHNLASAQALAGDFAGAEKTAAMNPGDVTWANVVDAQVKAGDFAAAKQAIEAHGKDGWWRQVMCRELASFQTKAGQAAAVREWAANQGDQLVKAHILVGVAQGLYDLARAR